MLGLLLRVAAGVIAAGATAAVVYTVYKRVTKRAIAEEAKKQLEKNDICQEALKAKIKKTEESKGTVTVDILDNLGKPVLINVEVHGEEIDNNLREGQEILLDEAC